MYLYITKTVSYDDYETSAVAFLGNVKPGTDKHTIEFLIFEKNR